MNRASVLLLLGPETGEKERFLDELRAEIEQSTGSVPETTTFYAFDTQIADLLSVLRNGALFAAHRIVVLKGAEEITKKGDIELLGEYIAHPAHEATLCLVADSPSIDKRLDKAVPPKAKRIFWELFDNQKRAWVTRYFREAGITISADASDLLLEMVDNSTRELKRECEKLALFFGAGNAIGEQDVETFLYHSKEENVFTLFDRIAGGDFAGSLEILQKVLLSGDANGVSLLSGLLWQFRRLHEIQSLLGANYSGPEACLKAKVRGKRAQKTYLAAAGNYRAIEIEAIITLIARYDALVRAARSETQALLLELFLYYSVVRRGREPEPYRS